MLHRGSFEKFDFRCEEFQIGKKLFPQFVRPLGGVDWWKKPEFENLMSVSL